MDEGECFVCARDASGFDPLAVVAKVEDSKKKRGGAVRGAVLGGVIGDDSDAAKTGAAVGAARQGRRNRQAQKAADEQQKKQDAELAAKREQFDKANSVCLEGRGYSVK